MYLIVLKDNQDFVLARCKTLKQAKIRLEDMEKTAEYLQQYYKWEKLPEYIIKEGVEK